MPKKKPNILITGTPGTGKSYLCQKIEEKLEMKWLDVSKIAKEHSFTEGFDEEYDCPLLDEDKVIDFLDPIMVKGGVVLEYHGCDFFPERWFDAIFVTRCNNTILYDRLEARDYSAKKIRANIECEIFESAMDEAKDAYREDIVYQLKNEDEEDARKNLKTIKTWYRNWKEP